MNKIMTVLLTLALIGIVNATPTGFSMNKGVTVMGDWQWMGSSWSKTYPPTAMYNYAVNSPTATSATVLNMDNLGTPWKYMGATDVAVNAATGFNNGLNAWTVNDPATTPATGGYTKIDYSEVTLSTNPDATTAVGISITGYGALSYSSNAQTTGSSQQIVNVGINQ